MPMHEFGAGCFFDLCVVSAARVFSATPILVLDPTFSDRISQNALPPKWQVAAVIAPL